MTAPHLDYTRHSSRGELQGWNWAGRVRSIQTSSWTQFLAPQTSFVKPRLTNPLAESQDEYHDCGHNTGQRIRGSISDRGNRFSSSLNTLRTGDADLRFYITTVQDGWRKSAFLTRACFLCTIHLIMQYIEPVSEWSCWRMFVETWPHSELTFRHRASSI